MLFNDDSLFETMLDVIPFGIYVVDIKTCQIVYMNRALIKSRGNFIGEICYQALYGETHPCLFCKNKQLVNENGVPGGNTIVFEHFNEIDDTWYQLQEKGMMWPDGRTVKYSIAVEISELKQVQNQLAEAHAELALTNRRLEAATRAKSMFLASMSHEIRTPMNAITGLSDLALKADMSPKVRDYLEKISLSAQSLLEIINDILDFSKIEAGRLTLEDIPFLLPDILERLSGLFHFKTAEKGIELIITMADDVPRQLSGDPTRLSQVLSNLLSNAVKFTESGEIILRISRSRQTKNRVRLNFSVADTGIGIPKKEQAGLFHAFTQVDGSTTRRYGGTGLGLSICKRLVEKMNGHIHVDSQQGNGSEFSFEADFGQIPESKRSRLQLPSDLQNLRVLLADDHPVSRSIMDKMLTSLTCNVTRVSSGEALLDKLVVPNREPDDYDLIITDWNMDGMDGLQVCAAIRKNPDFKTIPIILMSAFDRDGTLTEASTRAGADAFLQKPVTPSSLFNTLMAAFGPDDAIGKHLDLSNATSPAGDIYQARLLVVDDNDINRDMARELLENEGFIVDTAQNGEQAFEMVQSKRFDAVLMDIQMQGMNGFEATEKIREWENGHKAQDKPHLPVIAMTAHALEGDKERSLAAGLDDHVAKPIDTQQLLNVLKAHIQMPSKRLFSQKKEPGSPAGILPDSLPGLETASALRRLAGNTVLYTDLLLRFHKQMPDLMAQLSRAVENKDNKTAMYTAHMLKGLSGNIGAQTVHGHLSSLEQNLGTQAWPGCRASLADLKTQVDKVMQGIETGIKRPPAHASETDSTKNLTRCSDNNTGARTALDTLRVLLTEHNGQAFDQIKIVCSIPLLKRNPNLTSIENKINELDFEAALKRLDTLEKELRISLDTHGTA